MSTRGIRLALLLEILRARSSKSRSPYRSNRGNADAALFPQQVPSIPVAVLSASMVTSRLPTTQRSSLEVCNGMQSRHGRFCTFSALTCSRMGLLN